ncbi:MAG: tRNA (guanosine(46)-N7)-methyltransferase TrmB [Spirochaetia bacterium]|nr:tRNA (guanosine(46)-N7)-methyltransferase TrmB [Spirochaetia bacterium]
MEETFHRTIKSFVLRSGRITKLQQHALDTYHQLYCIPYDADKKLDFASIFGNSSPVLLEIGFGDGEATYQMAERNPGMNYLAMDVYPPGVGALLDVIHKKQLSNVRIVHHDAAEVVENMVPDGSAGGFHIFFPDPWQKKRHNKRRLINSTFVSILTDKLKDGGYIYCATDWEDYALQMQEVLRGEKRLYSPFEGFAEEPNNIVPWRPETKFERKGKAVGRTIFESYFIKTC